MARLLIDVLQDNRRKGRFLLHEFVAMPNHFHLLITPAPDVPLEKALQFIKGGFSYRAKKELNLNFAIWQAGFTNHRVRDPDDYAQHRSYIHQNPVKAGLADRPELFSLLVRISGNGRGCGATRAEAHFMKDYGFPQGLEGRAPRTKVRGFHRFTHASPKHAGYILLGKLVSCGATGAEAR
jgi:putative transposase